MYLYLTQGNVRAPLAPIRTYTGGPREPCLPSSPAVPGTQQLNEFCWQRTQWSTSWTWRLGSGRDRDVKSWGRGLRGVRAGLGWKRLELDLTPAWELGLAGGTRKGAWGPQMEDRRAGNHQAEEPRGPRAAPSPAHPGRGRPAAPCPRPPPHEPAAEAALPAGVQFKFLIIQKIYKDKK
jgi:hypothetical protein